MTTTEAPGAAATAALAERAAQVMVSGNTRSTLFVAPHPPYAARGAGAFIIDRDGHRVIDANNNYTSLIHGHAHPEVLAAVNRTMAAGTAFGLPTETEVELAELLQARTQQERWRFSNSGTEAVMTAIRAARAFTGRNLIVRFHGSYHGTSDAVVASSARGITEGVRSDVVELPQGDLAALQRTMTERGARVAAVLIDLMPNRAGLVPAEPEFVEAVRTLTQAHGALMIVDEVITLRMAAGGLARAYGITPDLITAGKIIGGGFPVGAVGGSADVLAVFDPLGDDAVGWGGTFSANPVTMTAGHAAMSLFDADAIARLNQMGDAVREEIVTAGVPATGAGSLLRIQLAAPPSRLWREAYQRGVLIGTNGLVALSTAMSEEDTAFIAGALIAAARATGGASQ